jgi:hypothetical protein
MSTLTFLPYIGEHFSKEYIIPNYIGESLSSLIPGLLALAQGVKTSEDDCENKNSTFIQNTTSKAFTSTTKQINLHRPNFTVSVYFFLMFVLLVFSILAFTALNYSQLAILERKKKQRRFLTIDDEHSSTSVEDRTEASLGHPNDHSQVETFSSSGSNTKKLEIRVLLLLTFVLTFINYGYLPGLLSYSTIPYSLKFFNLSINLSRFRLQMTLIQHTLELIINIKL